MSPPYRLTNKRICTRILIKNCNFVDLFEDADFNILDVFDLRNNLIDLRLVISLEAAGQEYD